MGLIFLVFDEEFFDNFVSELTLYHFDLIYFYNLLDFIFQAFFQGFAQNFSQDFFAYFSIHKTLYPEFPTIFIFLFFKFIVIVLVFVFTI